MKKELIGFSVCIMLAAILFVPNITADDETTQKECDESIVALNQPQTLDTDGWQHLHPAVWFPMGFQLLGKTGFEECFKSLKIEFETTTGHVFFLRGGRPFILFKGKTSDDAYALTYMYFPYGSGKFDIILTWTLFSYDYQEIYKANVKGFKVSLVG